MLKKNTPLKVSFECHLNQVGGAKCTLRRRYKTAETAPLTETHTHC